jgi:hypothetical protein
MRSEISKRSQIKLKSSKMAKNAWYASSGTVACATKKRECFSHD